MAQERRNMTILKAAAVTKYNTLTNWLCHSKRNEMVQEQQSYIDLFVFDENRSNLHAISKNENRNTEMVFQTLEKYDHEVNRSLKRKLKANRNKH